MARKFLLSSLALAGLLLGGLAHAQSSTSTPPAPPQSAITFPIAELGNCASKDECRAYCDDAVHMPACITFAESHGLMNREEAQRARDFSSMTGPGGCKGSACRVYCSDVSHQAECVKFGQEHGLIRPEEAKLIEDIQQNGGPGACRSKEECMAYCSDSAHQAECRAFAEEHGFHPPQQEDSQIDQGNQTGADVEEQQNENDSKIQAILKDGGPGGCTSKDACRAYCSDPSHSAECLAFAKDHQLITQEQFDQANKVVGMTGPGGCQGGDACRAYCADTSHRDECMAFAKEHGLVSQVEVERTAKLEEAIKEGGPGGCTDLESCKAFCSDSANRETCMSFAQEHGLIAPRPATQQQEGIEQGDADTGNTDSGVPTQTRTMRPALPPGMTAEQYREKYQQYLQSHPGISPPPGAMSPDNTGSLNQNQTEVAPPSGTVNPEQYRTQYPQTYPNTPPPVTPNTGPTQYPQYPTQSPPSYPTPPPYPSGY